MARYTGVDAAVGELSVDIAEQPAGGLFVGRAAPLLAVRTDLPDPVVLLMRQDIVCSSMPKSGSEPSRESLIIGDKYPKT